MGFSFEPPERRLWTDCVHLFEMYSLDGAHLLFHFLGPLILKFLLAVVDAVGTSANIQYRATGGSDDWARGAAGIK
jgi:hypothetical protein